MRVWGGKGWFLGEVLEGVEACRLENEYEKAQKEVKKRVSTCVVSVERERILP